MRQVKISIENPQNRDVVTFLQTCHETEGELTQIEVLLYPGGGNDLHYHSQFSEHFTAVEGVLQLETAEGSLELQPGESFTAPPGVLHRFYNDQAEPNRFYVEIRPGSEGFEFFLQIAYGLIRDGRTFGRGFPRSPLHAGVLLELGDTLFPGPIGLLRPLIQLSAWLAGRWGIKQRLIERYCETRLLGP